MSTSAPLDLSRKLLEEFETTSGGRHTAIALSSVPTGGGGSMSTDLEDFTASILNGISPAKGGTRHSGGVGSPAGRSKSGNGAAAAALYDVSALSTTASNPAAYTSVPRSGAGLGSSPYSADAKTMLRETQGEVTELRKALLTASQAVFTAQQELRVERQKAIVLEGERNKAISGIRSLHKMMEDREVELSIEKSQADRQKADYEEELTTLRVKVGGLEERNTSLEQEVRDVKDRHVLLLEDLGDAQINNKKLSSKLIEAKEYIHRKNAEVGKADAFVEGSLATFLRDANQFAAQWKTLRTNLDTFSADPMAALGGATYVEETTISTAENWSSPPQSRRSGSAARYDQGTTGNNTTTNFSPRGEERHQQYSYQQPQPLQYSDPTVRSSSVASSAGGRGLVPAPSDPESPTTHRSASTARYASSEVRDVGGVSTPTGGGAAATVDASSSLLAGSRWSALSTTEGLSSYSRGPSGGERY